MAISDRVKEAIDKLHQNDPINALIQISIAIDATGKKAYPGKKTSYRCKQFIKDNQGFIFRVSFGKLEIRGPIILDTVAGKKSFEQVLYDLIRCSLLHEGELPKEVTIVKESNFGVTTDGKVIISEKVIWGLILAVIGAAVNENESLPEVYTASIGETTLKLNDLWGEKDKIFSIVLEHNK
jgi:hypothetical protein